MRIPIVKTLLISDEPDRQVDEQLNEFISKHDITVIDIKFTTVANDSFYLNQALLIYTTLY